MAACSVFHSARVIATATDQGALTDTFQARVNDRFDFSVAGSRLEVETTTKDDRGHMLWLHQLKPVLGAVVRIAGMTTTASIACTSVEVRSIGLRQPSPAAPHARSSCSGCGCVARVNRGVCEASLGPSMMGDEGAT